LCFSAGPHKNELRAISFYYTDAELLPWCYAWAEAEEDKQNGNPV
jgi:hypothetical protein